MVPFRSYNSPMPDCPNCREAMAPLEVAGHGALRPIEINACKRCSLFWFDRWESVRLTPEAVLELFRFVGEAGRARKPLVASFRCPRCTTALAPVQDLQRTTRFTYWRCPRDEGRLITFHQFLREKNFIRAPSSAELARLRETVRQIACSQCGAPVDLASESACAHCGAPVAMIDPDGVTKALRELAGSTAAGAASTPDAMRARLSDAQIDAILDLERLRTREPEANDDLVAIGATAIGGLIAGLLGLR